MELCLSITYTGIARPRHPYTNDDNLKMTEVLFTLCLARTDAHYSVQLYNHSATSTLAWSIKIVTALPTNCCPLRRMPHTRHVHLECLYDHKESVLYQLLILYS